MQTKFKIEIVETLSRVIEINAENKFDALDKVNVIYKQGGIVLDSEDFVGCSINII